jgi:hypothetical protein
MRSSTCGVHSALDTKHNNFELGNSIMYLHLSIRQVIENKRYNIYYRENLLIVGTNSWI